MTTKPNDFDWARFKRSVSPEVYDFWKLNHDSPLSRETFQKIMEKMIPGEKNWPKEIMRYGDTWAGVYSNTQLGFGFWGIKDARLP